MQGEECLTVCVSDRRVAHGVGISAEAAQQAAHVVVGQQAALEDAEQAAAVFADAERFAGVEPAHQGVVGARVESTDHFSRSWCPAA